MKIGNRIIGKGHKPFIIAEMSGNHNQSIDTAKAIVKAAADAGADAIKLQTYTADTMTLDIKDGDFLIQDEKSLWNGRNLYELYEEAHTPWDWHKPLFDYARELGLIAFSSPFDDTAVDFLEELNVPCYKVASFEMTDLNLVKKIASTGKPMIISTGMATIAEIAETVETARAAGCEELVLLKCTSTYPASPEDTNLATIPLMRETFGCEVGLSDHTMGIGVPIASVALGASVIEKHFTLRRADGGVDSAFSIEPEELKQLVTEVERANLAVGKAKIGPSKKEENSKQFRRSIYVTKDVKAGEVISLENIRVVRPGFGLESKYLNLVDGLLFSRDVKAGARLNWDILKNERN